MSASAFSPAALIQPEPGGSPHLDCCSGLGLFPIYCHDCEWIWQPEHITLGKGIGSDDSDPDRPSPASQFKDQLGQNTHPEFSWTERRVILTCQGLVQLLRSTFCSWIEG